MTRCVVLLVMLMTGLGAPAGSAAHTAGEAQRALHGLAALHTTPPLALNGYSQVRFPHWRDPDHNGCDARQDALIHDGTNVKRGPRCAILSGSWFDRYSGATYRNPHSLDCDHVVPLANAWRTGARHWTIARRTQFANDPIVLVITSAHLNRQKGDRSPDQWKPPRRAHWFTYAARWIRIKTKYHLAVTRPERTALRAMLGNP